ncbi:hypothetical protein ONZ51_g10320 [Trametes cubensis]|uniref:Uncharacterized protein n=1 Tax=Trametes cubensis TaxID=1111947 RepID=A0AAD7TJP8_9APHY|nr:hypothetical protein ONZ51_g10320 [Trametes cubensis]
MTLTTTAAQSSVDADYVLRLKGAWSSALDTPSIHADFEAALQKVDPTLEIRRLNFVVLELKTLFRKLSLDFAKHDREVRRLRVRADGVQPLKPRWDKFRERFGALLDESQTNAMDASSVLKQYVNIFNEETLQSRDCNNLKTELENLIIMVDDRSNKAKTIEGSFTELADDIRAFEDDIGDTAKAAQDHAKNVYQDLEASRADVEALRARLTQVTKEMHEMGVACIACLSAGALSAGVFLLKLSPEAATAAVASVLTAVPLGAKAAKKWKETRKLRKQIREGERSISELERKYGALRVLQDSLGHSQGDLEGLASKIDAISEIWHLIKTDMNELRSQLSTVTTGKVTDLFMLKLSITRGVYHKLVQTLDEYARETTVAAGEDHDVGAVFGLCGEGPSSDEE